MAQNEKKPQLELNELGEELKKLVPVRKLEGEFIPYIKKDYYHWTSEKDNKHDWAAVAELELKKNSKKYINLIQFIIQLKDVQNNMNFIINQVQIERKKIKTIIKYLEELQND